MLELPSLENMWGDNVERVTGNSKSGHFEYGITIFVC